MYKYHKFLYLWLLAWTGATIQVPASKRYGSFNRRFDKTTTQPPLAKRPFQNKISTRRHFTGTRVEFVAEDASFSPFKPANGAKSSREWDHSTALKIDESTGFIEADFIRPRLLLLVCAAIGGSDFFLGRTMDDSMPASAASSARLLLAAIALSPHLPKLKQSLRFKSLVSGCFTAIAFMAQSIALVDTASATVAFLGSLSIVVIPIINWIHLRCSRLID